MNATQLKSNLTYYEKHRAERLEYQRRYKQTKVDKKNTEDNSKYSRRESVMIMSFIKKSNIYIPSKIDITDFVDTSSLTNFTHIPFTSVEYVKILAHVSPSIIPNKQPNIILFPYTELTELEQKRVDCYKKHKIIQGGTFTEITFNICRRCHHPNGFYHDAKIQQNLCNACKDCMNITNKCRLCNMSKKMYMFGDNQDKNICDNCNFDTIDMIDVMTNDIVNTIIDNINLTKHQISRKIINKKYRDTHKNYLIRKQHAKNQSAKLIKSYIEYHKSIYNNPYCNSVKPNDFHKK
jgi:hypothetical protein